MGVVTFNSTANTSWVSPITGEVKVECWGAGGGGASYGRTSPSHGGGGGGGGAYAVKNCTVTATTNYTIAVGGGGAAGANNSNGNNGGNTHFNNNEVKACGGFAGNRSGALGAGGDTANCVGSTTAAGGSGAANNGNLGGGGGGAAIYATGSSAVDQTGGTGGTFLPYTIGGNGGLGGGNNGTGANGSKYGGGGGGAGGNQGTTFKTPGSGENGYIMISWPDVRREIMTYEKVYAESKHEFLEATNDASNAVYGVEWRAQSFTIGTTGPNRAFTISSVELNCQKYLTGSANMQFQIKAVDGSGYPTGSALSSGTADTTGWSTSAEWHKISMSAYTVSASTQYTLVVYTADSGGITWFADSTSPTYTGGCMVSSSNSGSTWANNTGVDWLFRINGY